MEPTPKTVLPIILSDEWLVPVSGEIEYRYNRFTDRLAQMDRWSGGIVEYANAHLYLGFHRDPQKQGWWFREWLPAAQELYLFGDFNDWERTQYPLDRGDDGVWSIFIPDSKSGGRLRHGSLVKIYVRGADGQWLDRIPAHIRRVVQNDETKDYVGQLWSPEEPFDWQGDNFNLADNGNLIIYECHVGMAQQSEGVGSYREFTELILPRIKALGYNAIQMMAIAEHPYYGSFGYHVSNFYAPSSRFGTPEELRELIRTAHSMGLGVIMDIVHSHYVKNINEGINSMDGTDHLYSPPGNPDHPQWDSKLFDYGKHEVQHFLLSNVKYWLTEFHFDGFRFDGVSSMLYHHHGICDTWDRNAYFGEGANRDAILYLALANELTHKVRPGSITIAEDVSGMPGIAVATHDGGLGFDYRLAMAIPDFWIEYLKDVPDEQWDLHRMWSVLLNRLPTVKTIAYAESHDQALVGDKTLAFRLMDKEMYYSMDRDSQSIVVDRGMALHKMIRLITITLGGEAYLNFMGNEFGHPEWIDFPREGNNWSYAHARRQWSLAENPLLRYGDLLAFDGAMIELVHRFNILNAGYGYQLLIDDHNKTMAYEQANLVFVLNWHPTASVMDYCIPMPAPGRYRVVLDSDAAEFGGAARVDHSVDYFTYARTDEGGITRNYMNIYNISRAALVFERQKD